MILKFWKLNSHNTCLWILNFSHQSLHLLSHYMWHFLCDILVSVCQALGRSINNAAWLWTHPKPSLTGTNTSSVNKTWGEYGEVRKDVSGSRFTDPGCGFLPTGVTRIPHFRGNPMWYSRLYFVVFVTIIKLVCFIWTFYSFYFLKYIQMACLFKMSSYFTLRKDIFFYCGLPYAYGVNDCISPKPWK